MYDLLKDETIVRKVGGRFKLSTLLQKRAVALTKGARPLVNVDSQDKMEIALLEIQQDKIYLDASMEVRITGDLREGGILDLNPNEM